MAFVTTSDKIRARRALPVERDRDRLDVEVEGDAVGGPGAVAS